MNVKRLKQYSIGAITAATFLLTSACKKQDTTNNNNNNSTGMAYVDYIDASPSGQNCDLYDGHSVNTPQIPGFYYTMATNYNHVTISQENITIKDTRGTVLNTGQLSLEQDQTYTWLMYDTFPNIKYALVKDTLPTSYTSGKGAVKFINVCPNCGPLTYRLRGGAVLTAGLKPANVDPAHCYSNFVEMSSSSPLIEVLDANTLAVIDSVPTNIFSVTAGKAFTIWTGGYRGGTGNNEIKSFWTADFK